MRASGLSVWRGVELACLLFNNSGLTSWVGTGQLSGWLFHWRSLNESCGVMMLCLVPHFTDTDNTGRTNKMLTRETIHKNKTKSLQVLSEHYLCKNQDFVQFVSCFVDFVCTACVSHKSLAWVLYVLTRCVDSGFLEQEERLKHCVWSAVHLI